MPVSNADPRKQRHQSALGRQGSMKLRSSRLATMLAAVLVIGVLATAYGFFNRKGHAQSTTPPDATHVPRFPITQPTAIGIPR